MHCKKVIDNALKQAPHYKKIKKKNYVKDDILKSLKYKKKLLNTIQISIKH